MVGTVHESNIHLELTAIISKQGQSACSLYKLVGTWLVHYANFQAVSQLGTLIHFVVIYVAGS